MTEITITKGGPALVKPTEGDYVVVRALTEGEESFVHIAGIDKTIAICRCGLSKNGIMCDGSHKNKTKEDGI